MEKTFCVYVIHNLDALAMTKPLQEYIYMYFLKMPQCFAHNTLKFLLLTT